MDFAEIGEFIDTPVQSYSSGMQVRLGFAVATALQPDVLLLDEVLAVGDAAFRAKCYERLARIRDEAAFVLVSHDTDQIARVCSHVLVLDRGLKRYLGDVGDGIRVYQELSRPHTRVSRPTSKLRRAQSQQSTGVMRPLGSTAVSTSPIHAAHATGFCRRRASGSLGRRWIARIRLLHEDAGLVDTFGTGKQHYLIGCRSTSAQAGRYA